MDEKELKKRYSEYKKSGGRATFTRFKQAITALLTIDMKLDNKVLADVLSHKEPTEKEFEEIYYGIDDHVEGEELVELFIKNGFFNKRGILFANWFLKEIKK